jgi:hypothetical protein
MDICPLTPKELASRAKKCLHFNGLQNNECKAGVNYKSLPERKWGSFICFGESKGCEKYCETGEPKVHADHALANKYFRETVVARKAITDHTGGKRGTYGEINCPVCKGVKTLRFSVAGCNGHIHARCSTQDCVAWME